MKVRALQTIKYGSKFRIPGTQTEEFDIPESVYEGMKGMVEVVGPGIVNGPAEVAGLPDDLPQRHIFESLGIDSLDAIREIDDLTTIRGIGAKTAAAISDFLKGV